MIRFELREFWMMVRFGVVGLLATFIHMSVASGLVHFDVTGVFSANLVAYLIAFCVAFSGHFFWSFRSESQFMRSLWRYFIISASAFAVNNVVLLGLVSSGVLSKVASVLIAAAIVPAISYVASRFWGFRQTPGREAAR